MDQLTRIFLQEAADQLESLESLLLDLEENNSSEDLLQHFMRSAHSLKGASGTAGYPLLADLAHEVENLIQTLQGGRLSPGPDYFDLLYRSIETMRRYLDEISGGGGNTAELEAVCSELANWLAGNCKENPELLPDDHSCGRDFILGEYDLLRIKVLSNQGKKLYRIDLLLKPQMADYESAAVAIFKTLREDGDILQSIPAEGNLADISENDRLSLLYACEFDRAEIDDRLSKTEIQSASISDFHIQQKTATSAQTGNEDFLKTFSSEKTVRLEMDVLDELLRLVGELMLNRARFERISGDYRTRLGDQELSSEIEETAEKLGHLTSDLQSGIMRARMVPISRLFRMMKRKVRQVSRKQNTQARLIGYGENTEIDKKLFDLLAENLVELVELLTLKICLLSSATSAEITVLAERKGNNVVLRFECAGSPLTDEELVEAMEQIDECGGRLSSRETNGRFALSVSLPITLAIVPVMMVESGEEIYAFPLEAVKETLRLKASERTTVEGKEITEVRGDALSLLDIVKALDIDRTVEDVERKFVVVVESGLEPIGIVVDRLIGKRDVVIKPLGSHFASVRHISGSTILGDGRVALIVNSETMISEARGAAV